MIEQSQRILIRPLQKEETDSALQLAWKVFCEFESPDYAPEGTEEFNRCLNDDAYLAGIRYYGAFDGDRIVGVLGIREGEAHIISAGSSKTVDLGNIYEKIYREGRLNYEIERFTDSGDCEIMYCRSTDRDK